MNHRHYLQPSAETFSTVRIPLLCLLGLHRYRWHVVKAYALNGELEFCTRCKKLRQKQ